MTRHDTTFLVRAAARLLLMLIVSSGAWACAVNFPDTWKQPLQMEGPVQANGDLIYLDRTRERIHRLDPTRSNGDLALERTRVPTGREPTTMALSPNDEQLFVINAGDQTLDVYDLTASPPSRKTVQLDSPYDRIRVSPNGDFVLLRFSSEPDREACVVCNVNEVGIVDLRDGVPDSAEFLPLRKRATDLVFAEPFQVEGTEQRLVAALSPSLVTFINLHAVADGAGDDALREVQLTVSEADAVQNPEEARFDIHADDDTPAAAHHYVRTRQSRDITQVALTPSASESKTFDISVNQLAAGDEPAAMAIIQLADGQKRLMALDRTRSSFSLIDTQSGESESFELPIGASPEDMLTYEVAAGDGDEPETRVLTYSSRSEVVAVVRPETISVSSDNPTLGRSVEAVRLEQPPDSIQLHSASGRTRAIAALSNGNSAVLKLDADDNVATPIQSPPLADLLFGAEAAWGVFEGENDLARYDLATGHGTPYELPRSAERVFLDTEESLIAVQHESDAGTFSVLDLEELEPRSEPESTRVFEGVFLNKLLQQRSSINSQEE